MVRLPLKPGAVAFGDDAVIVSATCLRWRGLGDLVALVWPALRMRAGWPSVDGAVGLAIAVELSQRATWSLSVWRSEEALRRFLASPAHVAAMTEHRRRLSTSASATWHSERFVLGDAWQEARRRLR
jgi:hypothetical protein